ncbi:unnamed protein product [Symbiodinium sp. CCMP2592]|nr:unnamed protein product [Symbiodinium sp. CCMP2592]
MAHVRLPSMFKTCFCCNNSAVLCVVGNGVPEGKMAKKGQGWKMSPGDAPTPSTAASTPGPGVVWSSRKGDVGIKGRPRPSMKSGVDGRDEFDRPGTVPPVSPPRMQQWVRVSRAVPTDLRFRRTAHAKTCHIRSCPRHQAEVTVASPFELPDHQYAENLQINAVRSKCDAERCSRTSTCSLFWQGEVPWQRLHRSADTLSFVRRNVSSSLTEVTTEPRSWRDWFACGRFAPSYIHSGADQRFSSCNRSVWCIYLQHSSSRGGSLH